MPETKPPRRHWRDTLRSVHRWLGLVACLPLALQAASGIVLAVSENWLEAPHAAHAKPAEHGHPHELSEIVAAATAYAQDKHIAGQAQMVMMPAPDRPAVMRFGGAVFDVDTRSLEVSQRDSFVNTVHAWHERLLMPQGHAIVGVFGLALAFFGISGVILWWPAGRWRQALKVPAAGHYARGGYRAWYGWHLLLGGLSSAMALLVAVTGMSMAFGIPSPTVTAIARDAADFPKLAATGPLTLDQAVTAARDAVPGTRLRSAMLPRNEGGNLRVDLVPAGKTPSDAVSTTLMIDMAKARILSASHRAIGGDGVAAVRFIHALHSGNGFNPVWQIVVFAYGVVLFVMSTTGLLMWLRRPRRGAKQRIKTPQTSSSTGTSLPVTTSPVRSSTDA